jgi:arylsulfatase A-like enzyme/tetratricopeptide (TPR) repeat protein
MHRLLIAALILAACRPQSETAAPVEQAPVSILLVTLDTTRADAIGEATPAFNALAERGRRYTQAYASTPQTLPSHTSMMTGIYPAAHGIHENGRYLVNSHPLAAERLGTAGYRTAAFVSAFAVARRFGLARGFDVYDDDFGGDEAQRPANVTTDRAIAWLAQASERPSFLWVHYYDPHYPYEPPEPFRSQHEKNPYLGEVAFMDQEMGRLIEAFEKNVKGPRAIIAVADHGEGLGDHGEQQHGNLLYQETMRVPLVIAGEGIRPGVDDNPVATRRVFHTILDWAGLDDTSSLRKPMGEVVIGEAMKPFLDYGWKPQVMAVEGSRKAILAGRVEVYDLAADPEEKKDLGPQAEISRGIRAALRDYPVPSPQAAASPTVSEEERRKLASLGYVASSAAPVIRPDAPRPADMTRLFPILDRASGHFVRGEYAQALPLLERIQRDDPNNLDATLRLAVAHSTLGHNADAAAAFERARQIAPQSRDVRAYLALHYARAEEWERAAPLLEEVVREEPDRLPALEALAVIREREQRLEDAIRFREKVYAMRTPSGAELARLGELQMATGQTAPAIASFERARAALGDAFGHHLELGVLYLAVRRFPEARDSLDRVPSTHPGYPMALFKRAQVAVLLGEPDRRRRIEAARTNADATTKELIENERLFR